MSRASVFAGGFYRAGPNAALGGGGGRAPFPRAPLGVAGRELPESRFRLGVRETFVVCNGLPRVVVLPPALGGDGLDLLRSLPWRSEGRDGCVGAECWRLRGGEEQGKESPAGTQADTVMFLRHDIF